MELRRLYNERIAIEKKDLKKDGDDSCDDISRDLLYITYYYYLCTLRRSTLELRLYGSYDEEEKERKLRFGCMDQRMTVGIPGWWCSI